MATKYIAHASIGENGKVTGGSAGDQTGKEVCIREWYNKPWNYLLHIKNDKIRKQFGNNMIDIANNNNVGYNQSSRNTLLTQAIKVNFVFTKITTKCNTDCSAMVTAALLGAIYTILGKEEYQKAYKVLYSGSNCRTTSTLRSGLNTLGLITVYNSREYIGGTSKAVYGDIYIKEGSHVVCYVDTGKKVTVTTTSYYKKYTGKSLLIDTVFKTIGAPYGSVTKRKPVAEKNGYKGIYKGTATQNLKLISLAKQGKLKK